MAEFPIIFSRQFLSIPECLLFLPGLMSMLQPSACCSLQYILISLDKYGVQVFGINTDILGLQLET